MKYEHLIAQAPNDWKTDSTCFNIEVMNNGIVLITDSDDNKGAPIHKNLVNVVQTIHQELGIGFNWGAHNSAKPQVVHVAKRIFYMFPSRGLFELSNGSPNTATLFSDSADALKILYGE